MLKLNYLTIRAPDRLHRMEIAKPDAVIARKLDLKIEFPKIFPILDGSRRPFWSVMIPSYNRTKYLEQALRSVLTQDPGPDEMQIEVIDDGSTQTEVEAIVKRVGRGRVSFYRLPQNIGQPHIFSTCIQRASGCWIHILHDDDFVLPEFYNRLRVGIESAPDVGAAFCRHYFTDPEGNPRQATRLEQETPGILQDWLERIAVGCFVQFCAIVVKRQTYEQLGGFCPMARSAADWEMWKRIAVHYPVWFEPQLLACYRPHPAAASVKSIGSGKRIINSRNAIEISRTYLPAELADTLTNKAKEVLALDALNLARIMFQKGDLRAATINIREGLNINESPLVVKSLVALLKSLEVNPPPVI